MNSRDKELQKLDEYCSNKVVLELGSEAGISSYRIAETAKHLTCVDAWDDSFQHVDRQQRYTYLHYLNQTKGDNLSVLDTFKKTCDKFIKSEKIKYIRGLTEEVVDSFENESFDVVFIDADHSLQGVRRDIKNYLPKLKTEGFLLLHDYGPLSGWPNVSIAAQELVSSKEIKLLEVINVLGIFLKL